ncbi:heme-binding protein [Noviherbaspirillum sp.]|uniref:GlcG/HbpS family heme-binding protein n=1 Tax=Noviherbaspirillum sp. TaxID=1926288 RepID=UPI002B47E175|nr:heme-binding protein [Noviherbaspirillum sp.]HJV80217.1 heme-binding protein [Noviherbaspirillum sp.]
MQVAIASPGITWEAASAAAQAAVRHAEANGWRINVAVVTRGGSLMAFLRMPGAFLHSIDIAIDKAYTAASFGFPTKDWMAAVGHDDGMKFGFSAQHRLIVFGGGLPMRMEGDEWIGGIGVSGASEAQDEECARVGLDAIGLRP